MRSAPDYKEKKIGTKKSDSSHFHGKASSFTTGAEGEGSSYSLLILPTNPLTNFFFFGRIFWVSKHHLQRPTHFHYNLRMKLTNYDIDWLIQRTILPLFFFLIYIYRRCLMNKICHGRWWSPSLPSSDDFLDISKDFSFVGSLTDLDRREDSESITRKKIKLNF